MGKRREPKLRWSGSIKAQHEHMQAVFSHPPKPKPKKKKPLTRAEKRRIKKREGRERRIARVRELRLLSYPDYLRSDWWRMLRKKKIRSVGRACERCKSTTNLQVHHKHYKSLGEEKLSDLEVLCDTCHGVVHECLRQADAHLRSICNPDEA